ncbi:hypothetical protein C2E31_06260 [Rhodopirellula baltica]|nr:hypothetical protein C2E31_06260 [Rhodopirellula baltica]
MTQCRLSLRESSVPVFQQPQLTDKSTNQSEQLTVSPTATDPNQHQLQTPPVLHRVFGWLSIDSSIRQPTLGPKVQPVT